MDSANAWPHTWPHVATLAPIAYVAFGDGGHNADMTPKAAGSSVTALYHEVLRKPLTSISQEDLLSVTGKGVVDSSEIVGGVIQAGLIDADGHLVGWKTFAPKFTEEGDLRRDPEATFLIQGALNVA